MTLDETKEILRMLKSNFPDYFKKISKEDANRLLNDWNTSLGKESLPRVKQALERLLDNPKGVPNIYQVKRELSKIKFTGREYTEEDFESIYMTPEELRESTKHIQLKCLYNGVEYESFEKMMEALEK